MSCVSTYCRTCKQTKYKKYVDQCVYCGSEDVDKEWDEERDHHEDPPSDDGGAE